MDKKKKARQRKHKKVKRGTVAGEGPGAAGDTDKVEDEDLFEVEGGNNLEIQMVNEGQPTIQDLDFVIKVADLSEPPPPPTSDEVVGASCNNMTYKCSLWTSFQPNEACAFRCYIEDARNQKGNLVFLQVEHRLLRVLSEKPSFKDQCCP